MFSSIYELPVECYELPTQAYPCDLITSWSSELACSIADTPEYDVLHQKMKAYAFSKELFAKFSKVNKNFCFGVLINFKFFVPDQDEDSNELKAEVYFGNPQTNQDARLAFEIMSE